MWTPTHVQVTVHKARNLVPKGKNGTNDAYSTIQLGKEKYQTTVKEKEETPEWHEECDLPIPDMESSIIINCYHRNLLGLDEFLGHINIPLQSFQIYERPKSRWYALKNKPRAKKAEKYRGEVEVKVTFIVLSLSKSELNIHKIKRTASNRSLTSVLGDRLQSRMEKSKSKQHMAEDCDSENTLQKIKHDALKVTKSSPAKLEKKRQSRSHEVLPTTPSFSQLSTLDPSDDFHPDNRSLDSRDHCANDTTPSKTSGASSRKQTPPPKPPRTFLKEKSPEPRFTQSATDLHGPVSVSKLHRSPKLIRSRDSTKQQNLPETDIKSPAENTHKEESETNLQTTASSLGNSDQSLTSKSDSLNRSLEEEDYFSRSNSFRQVIQRGSIRRSGGSIKEKQQKSEVNSSPLLTATRRFYTDSTSSLDKVPEKVEAAEQTQRKPTTKSTGSVNDIHMNGKPPKLEENLPGNTPKKRDKKHILDASKRHTICFDATDSSSSSRLSTLDFSEPDIQPTKSETQVPSSLPNDVLQEFHDKDREALIRMVLDSRTEVQSQQKYVNDLEEYIDRLLVKVIDIQPRILQTPYPSPLLQHQRPSRQNTSPSVPTGTNSGLILGVGVGTGVPRYANNSTLNSQSYSRSCSTLPSYGYSPTVAKNNSRNISSSQGHQQGYTTTNNTIGSNRSRMSPPKVIRAGQNNLKKDKKSTNPFKRITNALKN